MRESLGLALISVGAAIAAIAPIGGWIAVFRLWSAQHAPAGDATNRAAAMWQHTISMLIFAMIGAAGLLLLVLGLVIGYGIAAWAPALPAGILLGSAAIAAYARWRLAHLTRR